MRRELGIPEGSCVALYSGSMGRKQGLDYVIEAARILATNLRTSPLFLIAGGGPERTALEQRAGDLANVRFLPLQPEERLNEFLALGDIHLLPQLRNANDLVMPSKLGAMLAAGKPVIATVPSDSQIALTLGKAGTIVQPENPGALASAIEKLAGDPEMRRHLSKEARLLALRSFDATALLAAAESDLLRLCGLYGKVIR
jgi:colanic acid biosynthesis glycosyl transferase WcaI